LLKKDEDKALAKWPLTGKKVEGVAITRPGGGEGRVHPAMDAHRKDGPHSGT